MINFNGNILEEKNLLSIDNRGFNYGDALFETIKVSLGKVLFWEDHYFRLMASMRIMRMEIPMDFTMQYLENQIQELLKSNHQQHLSSRVKFTVFRNEGGLYLPTTNHISFLITSKTMDEDFYLLRVKPYEVDLFKDFYISPSLLSTLKTNNKAINVVGSIYAQENNLQNCLLLNTEKMVVEALNGNLFVVKDHVIKTPPLTDGCLKGIMRKQVMEVVRELPDYQLIEASVSPFELQKADELWITNVITGIQPISKYRKKTYVNNQAKRVLPLLNAKMRKD
ncbi:MAG: aminotransferase class IV [Flavobacteriales bacterium]|nr:aminotransferase class IV [Flavobacteriales bacterium]NCQ15631.1 aminotransferase class IV [Flavobacteriales bacterium]PIV95159.1 MAG: aminotransferase class IV [Flavobacteriaceae bacterium CG17_big_fil_post_rev_8_21_14_2_50_33_15]